MASAIYRYKWDGNFSMSEIERQIPLGQTATEEAIGPQTFVDIKIDNGANPVPATTQEDLDDYMAALGWQFVAVDPDESVDGAPLELARWNAEDGVLTPADAPTLVTRNERELLAYTDSGGPSDAYFTGVIPRNYVPDFPLRVKVWWAAATATAGDVRWNVGFEKLAPNSVNIDTDSFAALKAKNEPTNATNGVINISTFNFDQAEADNIAPGNPFRLVVRRQRGAPGDTMVGDAQVLRVAVVQ